METDATTPIHIGQLVKKYLKVKRISKAALGRKIEKDDATMLRYEKCAVLKTSVLWDLSHALKHNFFADIADFFPKTYSTDAVKDTSKDERIVTLEEENRILKAEVAVLLKAIRGTGNS